MTTSVICNYQERLHRDEHMITILKEMQTTYNGHMYMAHKGGVCGGGGGGC